LIALKSVAKKNIFFSVTQAKEREGETKMERERRVEEETRKSHRSHSQSDYPTAFSVSTCS